MSFEPGHKKLGGRKKGTPNKINKDLNNIFENTKYNPIDTMISIAQNPNTDPSLLFAVSKELAQYLYAKKKSFAERLDEISDEELATEAKRRLEIMDAKDALALNKNKPA